MLALEPLRGVVVIDEVQRHPDLFPVLRGGYPRAVLAESDAMLIRRLQSWHANEGERLVRRPKVSEWRRPPLMSLNQPVGTMAEAAIRTLLSEDQAAPHEIFPGEPIVRSSCGCQ